MKKPDAITWRPKGKIKKAMISIVNIQFQGVRLSRWSTDQNYILIFELNFNKINQES